jgi:putative transposase
MRRRDQYACFPNGPKLKRARLLALAARPRFHLRFTPTYASWLNQVERSFALLSQRQIRRGSFVSPNDLVAKMGTFVDAYNARSAPFVWTATSEAILEKLVQIYKAINGTRH